MRKQQQLEAHCEDDEKRSRRSNLQIYGVKEGTEGDEIMLDFTAKLLKTVLKLSDEDNLGIEHAHRSIVAICFLSQYII